MPKPEIGAVGATFAESEVRHADAYSNLIQVLGLNSEFENLLQVPGIRKRIKYLDKKQVSYLTWGRCNKKEDSYTWIDEDIEHSSELAVKYIISKGHKKICFIESEQSSNYFELRKKYFLYFW